MSTLALLAFVSLVTLIIMLINEFVNTAFQNDYLNEGLLSPYCRYFMIDNKEQIDLSFLNNRHYNGIALMKMPTVTGMAIYETIYSGVDYNILVGRNYIESDFSNNKKAALVGCDMEMFVNNNYVYIYDEPYEKIGEFQLQDQKTYIIYYTNGSINKVDTSGVFILDGVNHRTIKNKYLKIEKKLEELGCHIVEYIPQNTSPIASMKDNLNLLIIVFMVLYFVAIHYISAIWLNSNSKIIVVKYLIGKPYIELTLCLVYAITYIFSIAIAFLFEHFIIGNISFSVLMLLLVILFIELIWIYLMSVKVQSNSLKAIWEDFHV